MKKKSEPKAGEHGPVYNVTGAGLAGFRKALNPDRQAYGAAVEVAVLAMQRREMLRESTEPEARPMCASGVYDEHPGDAIRRQQQAALRSCPSRIAGLSPDKLTIEYWAVIRALRGPDYIPSWERPIEAPADFDPDRALARGYEPAAPIEREELVAA
jgi:hypothetical protein